MAHVMRYKLVDTLDSGDEMSPEASAIYQEYVADGKITDFDNVQIGKSNMAPAPFSTPLNNHPSK